MKPQLDREIEEIENGLKELRRQAGYEPNAWYDEQESKLLNHAIREAQATTKQELVQEIENLFPDDWLFTATDHNAKIETQWRKDGRDIKKGLLSSLSLPITDTK